MKGWVGPGQGLGQAEGTEEEYKDVKSSKALQNLETARRDAWCSVPAFWLSEGGSAVGRKKSVMRRWVTST
jgi:hypothetical protein